MAAGGGTLHAPPLGDDTAIVVAGGGRSRRRAHALALVGRHGDEPRDGGGRGGPVAVGHEQSVDPVDDEIGRDRRGCRTRSGGSRGTWPRRARAASPPRCW